MRALRAQYGNEMDARWTLLDKGAAELSVRDYVEYFVDVMVQLIEEHPAYIPLFEAPLRYKRDQQARNRLRERVAKFFRARQPSLTPEQAFRVAKLRYRS